MIGIRIEDELRVGQVLLKDERIHAIDDNVIASVDHQRRVRDRSQIVKRAGSRCTPLADRADLCRCDPFDARRVLRRPGTALMDEVFNALS